MTPRRGGRPASEIRLRIRERADAGTFTMRELCDELALPVVAVNDLVQRMRQGGELMAIGSQRVPWAKRAVAIYGRPQVTTSAPAPDLLAAWWPR